MKIFIVLFEKIELLKRNYRITDFSDFCFFASFLRYFSLFDMYRRRLYNFVIIKRNYLKLCMFGVAGETHIPDSFKVILFDKRKDIKPSSISHYARVT